MAKTKKDFLCNACEAKFPKWSGRCGHCGEWDSLVEVEHTKNKSAQWIESSKIQFLDQISINEQEERWVTGVHEFDRVIGGGIIKGSIGLLGGTPGVGKSTLILQLLARLVKLGKKVLYVSGEESASQIKARSLRLIISPEGIQILIESNLENIESHLKAEKPDFVVIDSIQTLYTNQFTGSSGSVTQVRESAAVLMQYAKTGGVTIMLIGHVTKTGNIAGPKTLEHMVDYVLYLEGEHGDQHRILRSVKNRFGALDEIGIFKMTPKGLSQVSNPNSIFIEQQLSRSPGTAVFPSIEGARTILLEIQSLVGETFQPRPSRTALGVDRNKLQVLIAVLEKHLQIDFSQLDIYLNLSGGFRVTEPTIDLAIMASVLSSHLNLTIPNKTLFLGEAVLTGEFRGVHSAEERVKEGFRCGFEVAILPKQGLQTSFQQKYQSQIHYVNHIQDLFKLFQLWQSTQKSSR